MKEIALTIFIITYLGIIFTRLPWINIDRPSAAFFGAVAMIACGVISFDEGVRAIDFNTIALLLGMMIMIAVLELDGFFSLIAEKAIAYSQTRSQLLWIVVFITGISSAFLVNDAVVLLFTPVIIEICKSGNLNPVPYLIAEILASNAGSTMTITGNPQNMLIGINSGIHYGNFLLYLMPVSIISMVIIVFIVKMIYRKDFEPADKLKFKEDGFKYNFASMKTSVPIFLLMTILFFFSRTLHLPIPVIALAGGSLVLLLGRIRPSTVIKEIDWVLLLFFASLFIVVHGVEKVGLLDGTTSLGILTPDSTGIGIIHGVSLVFSQIVSNVPLTVVMLPVMKAAGSTVLWLALASASTLAGNATIIGAMANLIVLESAKKSGITIGFLEFIKTGFIVTVLSFVVSFSVLAFYLKAGML